MQYYSENYILELTLFKKLLNKYDKYVILDAIERFMEANTKCKAIAYFSSTKFFENRFADIIKLTPIIKYQRLLLSYPVDLRDKVKSLIDEYKAYASAMVLSNSEKARKKEIIEELEKFEYKERGNEVVKTFY